MSGFLSKCTAGKFVLGKLLRQSHKNQTQKTKFWRKMLQKSYFLKKTFFLIFARFLKKKKTIPSPPLPMSLGLFALGPWGLPLEVDFWGHFVV
jgi:hypothetical protein